MKPSNLRVIDADVLKPKLAKLAETYAGSPIGAVFSKLLVAIDESTYTLSIAGHQCMRQVVDDNPEIGRPMYSAGQVFEHDDGRMGMLIKTMAGEPYIFLESTREAFVLINSPTAPTPLFLEQVVGRRDVARWRPTEREFQTAPFSGDAYGPEMSQVRHH